MKTNHLNTKYTSRHQVKFFLVSLGVFGVLFLSGCRNKPDMVNNQASWKSSDPSGIPLQVRLSEINKLNLVINPSFENGKYYVDSVNRSFALKGWRKIGKNVSWTDIQNEREYGINEAYHGLHSVKITRNNSDETDNQGEGVLSDFIKVVPGNYKLSLYLKLEKVESNISRLTPALYDAVNLRILFYNKGKLLLKSNEFNPATNTKIDNSFKGFSFSKMNYIESMDWTRVQGKSAHFPFIEGDIPDEARYVRIFLGLKGNGTMWIDMVRFGYSADNINLLEACSPYFDSVPQPHAYLIPSPREFTDYSPQPLIASVNDMNLEPLIIIPVNADDDVEETARRIAGIFGDALARGKKSKPARIISRIDESVVNSGRLIISIGKTNLCNEHSPKLPFTRSILSHGMYTIYRLREPGRLIFIDAADAEGFLHAVNTIRTLTDKSSGIYHHYDILDSPDIKTRAVVLPVKGDMSTGQVISHVRSLEETGYNLFIFQDGDDNIDMSNAEKKISRFADLKNETRRSSLSGSRFGVSLLNLPADEELFTGRSRSNIVNRIIKNYSDDFDLFIVSDNGLWDRMELGSKVMVNRHITPDDFTRFIKSRNNFISSSFGDLSAVQKGKILYLPVFSDNENITSGWYPGLYYGQLKDYEDHFRGLLWKGPVEYPSGIDYAEASAFRLQSMMPLYLFINNLTTRRDNRLSLANAPGLHSRIRMGNIFEPFSTDLAGTPVELGLSDFCLINQDEISSISRIRLMTASDYLWNMKSYNPSISAWKILVRIYGKENAMLLVNFNDTFFRLMQICMIVEDQRPNARNNKECEELIIQLNSSWNEVKKNISHDISLLNELSDMKNQLIGRAYKIMRPAGNFREKAPEPVEVR